MRANMRAIRRRTRIVACIRISVYIEHLGSLKKRVKESFARDSRHQAS